MVKFGKLFDLAKYMGTHNSFIVWGAAGGYSNPMLKYETSLFQTQIEIGRWSLVRRYRYLRVLGLHVKFVTRGNLGINNL